MYGIYIAVNLNILKHKTQLKHQVCIPTTRLAFPLVLVIFHQTKSVSAIRTKRKKKIKKKQRIYNINSIIFYRVVVWFSIRKRPWGNIRVVKPEIYQKSLL